MAVKIILYVVALDEYIPVNIKNSPMNPLVSGKAMFARVMITSISVRTGALAATPAEFTNLPGPKLLFNQEHYDPQNR